MPRKPPPPPRMTKLAFAPWEYNPQALENRSERELRREYSRLRSIAKKRLDRLMASEFADSQAVAYNAGLYIPLAAVQSRSELTHLLTDLARFITSEQSTITGQRAIVNRLVQTWQGDKGFTFVNAGNVRSWVRFLDYVQSEEGYVYDIAAVATAFEDIDRDMQRSGGSWDADQIHAAYEYYVENTER